MDARIVGSLSQCTATRQTALGYVSFPLTFTPPSLTLIFRRHTRQNVRTVAYLCSLSHTQINGGAHKQRTIDHPTRRERDRARLACSSKTRQMTTSLSSVTSLRSSLRASTRSTTYRTSSRGTSATMMKAISCATSEWWAVKIIYPQSFRASNDNDSDNNECDNNYNNHRDSTHFASLAREVSILERPNHPNICRLPVPGMSCGR